MKVGLNDINNIELQDGQHIRIFDKENNKIVVEGMLKYVPATFIIYPNDGSHKLLLYWYVRNDEYENARDRYEIEVLQ